MNTFDLRLQPGSAVSARMGRSLQRIGQGPLLMLATAVGYGLAAWGGLTFLTGASNIAIFWPASGLSAGLAIAIGRSGYGAIALGIFLATIAVNVLFGRDPVVAAGFGLINVGETLLMARLLELVPEQEQAFRRVMRALAFFGAAIASTATAGLSAALLLDAGAPDGVSSLLDLWRTWSLSGLVGIIVVAPLLIAIHELATTPELRKTLDWKADLAVLFPFLAVAYHTLGLRLDDGSWIAITPGAALLPLLLWISARSQPIMPALAILILAIMMAWFAAAGSGRYGDVRLQPEARIIAAQLALGTATVVAQVVMALYTDRRLAVAHLKASERRLAAIVDTAPGMIFSAETKPDGTISFPFVSSTSSDMLGISAQQLAAEPSKLFDRLDPRDRSALFKTLRGAGGRDALLALELPFRTSTAGEKWIEIKARAVQDGTHGVIWHGFIQDITMRRRLVEELSHRTRNLLSVTQAIAELTARYTPSDELPDVLAERLGGLAASHEILALHRWEGAELEPLAKAQLSHLADLIGQRLVIAGPPVLLQAQAAQVIGMAIHELATNACKYGALATPQGTVHLSWSTSGHRDGEFRMCWRERGGKPLPEAVRKGFGSKITMDMPAHQLKGDVHLESSSDGLTWKLTSPAENVIRFVERDAADEPHPATQLSAGRRFNGLA